jgi:hypothetical protein
MYEKAYIMMYIRYELYGNCGSEILIWLVVTQAKTVDKEMSLTEHEIWR